MSTGAGAHISRRARERESIASGEFATAASQRRAGQRRKTSKSERASSIHHVRVGHLELCGLTEETRTSIDLTTAQTGSQTYCEGQCEAELADTRGYSDTSCTSRTPRTVWPHGGNQNIDRLNYCTNWESNLLVKRSWPIHAATAIHHVRVGHLELSGLTEETRTSIDLTTAQNGSQTYNDFLPKLRIHTKNTTKDDASRGHELPDRASRGDCDFVQGEKPRPRMKPDSPRRFYTDTRDIEFLSTFLESVLRFPRCSRPTIPSKLQLSGHKSIPASGNRGDGNPSSYSVVGR
ncbi:hypothetical protein J6590_010040 [Homalodisca vitripennis]|nr:hypothetical protein J6590_010040 [Homalodisca vitripennis]